MRILTQPEIDEAISANTLHWSTDGRNGDVINWYQLDLRDRSLSAVNLMGAVIIGCNLNGVDLSGANLEAVDFTGSTLVGADLTDAIADHAHFIGVDLSGACLDRMHSKRTDFTGAVGI